MSANITRKDSTGDVLTVEYKNKRGQYRLESIRVQRARNISSIARAVVWICQWFIKQEQGVPLGGAGWLDKFERDLSKTLLVALKRRQRSRGCLSLT